MRRLVCWKSENDPGCFPRFLHVERHVFKCSKPGNAEGCFKLGSFTEANDEHENQRRIPRSSWVLELRWYIYDKAKKWKTALDTRDASRCRKLRVNSFPS